MKQPQQNDYELNGIFPTPVYIAKRDSEQEEDEEKEVEDIIKGNWACQLQNAALEVASREFKSKI